jgi:vacuolar-type H+-ATPase subunit H
MTVSNDYTQTLKAIKDAEEASANALAEKKKLLVAQLEAAQEQASKDVAAAKAAAEEYIAKEVEIARASAEAKAKLLVASTQEEAESIAAKKLGKTQLDKIIEDILLSEFEGA